MCVLEIKKNHYIGATLWLTMKRPSAKDKKCTPAKNNESSKEDVKKRPAGKAEKQHTAKCEKPPSTAEVETLLASAKSQLFSGSEDYSGHMEFEDGLGLAALEALAAKLKVTK